MSARFLARHVMLLSVCRTHPRTRNINFNGQNVHKVRWIASSAIDSVISKEKDGYNIIDPALYVVGTPIGCLDDITLRALKTLQQCDKILCEDTRRTSILLRHFDISTPMESYHLFNEYKKIDGVLQAIQNGASLALVSDAGMPAINDPGGQLIAAAAKKGISIVPIPGPSATLSALVASGLPTETFTFCGFAEAKLSSRKKQLESWVSSRSTLIFFVSPHNLVEMLQDACAILGGERRCCVARELTKKHEEFWRSTLTEAKTEFKNRGARGEFTVVIEGCQIQESRSVSDDEIMVGLQHLIQMEGFSPSKAAKEISITLNIPRKRAYNLSLGLKAETLSTDGDCLDETSD